MPLYRLGCCDKEIEVIQGLDKDTPLCPDCGAKMKHLPTRPAIITMVNKGKIPVHSKGYKEDYYKDYQRRLQESKTAAQ